jgi:hypothetical protein
LILELESEVMEAGTGGRSSSDHKANSSLAT